MTSTTLSGIICPSPPPSTREHARRLASSGSLHRHPILLQVRGHKQGCHTSSILIKDFHHLVGNAIGHPSISGLPPGRGSSRGLSPSLLPHTVHDVGNQA